MLPAALLTARRRFAGTNDFFFLGDPQSPWGANATTGVARMSQLLELAFRTLPEVSTRRCLWSCGTQTATIRTRAGR